MTTSTTHRFTFKTMSETRSNRRDRTYTIEAADYRIAHDMAIDMAENATGAYMRTHWATLVDVDGNGLPADCPHLEYFDAERDGRPVVRSAFTWKHDGGRCCADCATMEA